MLYKEVADQKKNPAAYPPLCRISNWSFVSPVCSTSCATFSFRKQPH